VDGALGLAQRLADAVVVAAEEPGGHVDERRARRQRQPGRGARQRGRDGRGGHAERERHRLAALAARAQAQHLGLARRQARRLDQRGRVAHEQVGAPAGLVLARHHQVATVEEHIGPERRARPGRHEPAAGVEHRRDHVVGARPQSPRELDMRRERPALALRSRPEAPRRRLGLSPDGGGRVGVEGDEDGQDIAARR